ncbi:MAG: hypothetical protein ACREX4_15935 [Gammaproteobacteria bacterium]
MTAPAATLEVTQYTAQYELLRAQVVGTVSEMALDHKARQPRGIGLASVAIPLPVRSLIPKRFAARALVRASSAARIDSSSDMANTQKSAGKHDINDNQRYERQLYEKPGLRWCVRSSWRNQSKA